MYISPQIVVGFHGCSQAVADKVLEQNEHLKSSKNDYDWLGHGIYFWEGDADRAKQWAEQCHPKDPAVLGAFIKVGNCLDLLNIEHIKQVQKVHKILSQEYASVGEPLPSNQAVRGDISYRRELDCKVITRLIQLNKQKIIQSRGLDIDDPQFNRYYQHDPRFIDCIRGMFPEGDFLYEGAGFRAQNHIQLCVVNPNAIVGYFKPIKKHSWFKSL